ncbi:MAG: hypothetical protein A2W93_01535 [Bacteroidetes bacterium GWF2_43_63]|nr:MAG: hypothetical protein A2W94_10535 [Bacteroidetes bacterium GWE2_42_42]OFY55750.1 MAG: hypothetical protein A2W93_01535 [Bacteroidetes bacterium GWF2_43_63]HBG71335.1 hypothetical protein [Bacteroidales bacterium]HCB60445.1 hypothetical protein [Bacteroidales bacterium]HCY22598.1 hypothetical protein [Bacteroidales bacterium]
MRTIIFAVILLAAFVSHAQMISELQKSGSIKCYTIGNDSSVHYALPLAIRLVNAAKTKLDVKIPAGFVFVATDSSYQNIVITESIVATLQPGQTKQINLRGMCMEQSDHAPSGTCHYNPDKMAADKIVKLAQFIEKNKFWSPAGQQAMWTLIDDEPLYGVSSLDTSQAAILQKYLSELTGKKIEEIPADESYLYDYQVKPHKVTVGGEVEFNMKHKIMVVWALYSEDGILLREMYNGPVEGHQTLNFEYDAEVYSDPVYYLKLVADDKILYNKRLSFDR